MPSLLPSYEYDIFISYRQNDNRSGWVTEFVKALEEELSATIKQPVSVYFDSSPHDGLLETHNVDKSLESKLKCAILIPILSQTYCDPKSFAWQHEFCAFNNLAKGDEFGRDIKLGSGNVASRILPIKIHDLDAVDQSAIENETGGILRAIEFIYRESGVNRPLKSTDSKTDNQAKTDYRNQVNKVSNAVKEILAAMQNPGVEKVAPIGTQKWVPKPGRKRMGVVASLIGLLILSVMGYLFYGKFGKPKVDLEDTPNSIAVLPFTNMSQDPEQEYFSDGITEQIITNLAHINSLKVIARTSVMKFKKTEKSITEIAKELDVTHVLQGSIRRSGDRVRVNAQLISAKDQTHLWAQDYDRPLADIFTVQDEVSQAIASSLQRRLTPREYESVKGERPSNIEAYQHFLKGYYMHYDVFVFKRREEDFLESEREFKAAIQLDPGYGLAFGAIADLYDSYSQSTRTTGERLKFESLRDSCTRIAMRLSPKDPYVLTVRAYPFISPPNPSDAEWDSAFKYIRRGFALAPNHVRVCDQLSMVYLAVGLFDQAIRLRERTISLDPTSSSFCVQLARVYLYMGEYEKAEVLLGKARLMEPDGISALFNYAWLKMETRDIPELENTIQKIKDLNRENNTRLLQALLFALKGEKEKALAISKVWPVYLALGMKAQALDGMEKVTPLYLHLKNSPLFESVRKEPRFVVILEKAKVIYEERLKKYAN